MSEYFLNVPFAREPNITALDTKSKELIALIICAKEWADIPKSFMF
jgi:hypothetical protein